MIQRFVTALVVAMLTVPHARASLILVTTKTNDTSFEGAGGFLQTTYGLPLTGGTALPPLERAVAQVTGSRTSNNTGLHVPNATTGLPFDGTGVTQALTNVSPLTGGGNTPFVSGTPVSFSYSRTGTKITFTQGGLTFSSDQSYYASIDALELRTRSKEPDSAYTSTSISYTNLSYTDAVTAKQVLPTVSAANGAVYLQLYSGVVGNFSLTGDATLSWAGPNSPPSPGNSALNAQIKALDLPTSVPEPASAALLGLGLFGLAALRRRKGG